MSDWPHQQVAVGYAIEPIAAGDLVETYTRSWRERLFSWPWKPWFKRGVRRSALATMIEAREWVVKQMQEVTGVPL